MNYIINIISISHSLSFVKIEMNSENANVRRNMRDFKKTLVNALNNFSLANDSTILHSVPGFTMHSERQQKLSSLYGKSFNLSKNERAMMKFCTRFAKLLMQVEIMIKARV